MKKKKIQENFSDFMSTALDSLRMCISGIFGVMKNWRYPLIWLFCALFFAYFLTFFKDGTLKFSLLFSGLHFDEKIWLLINNFQAMLANFSNFFGWFIVIASILQGLAISLLIFNYRHKQEDLSTETSASGFGILLSFFALGCPSCGVSMLAPVITTVIGAGALAFVNVIGGILIVLVFILLAYAIIKLGSLSYITLSAKKYKEKNERK